MHELALHILDLVQNSIVAEASLIEVEITVDCEKDLLTIVIQDNGKGMSEDFLKEALSPFRTSRKTRKVGLGLSLFKLAANQCDGDVSVESELGVGTKVSATFSLSHVDRPPLGDLAETFSGLIMMNPSIDFVLKVTVDKTEFLLDTRELRTVLGEEVSLSEPDVAVWIRQYADEGLSEITGGKPL